MTFFIQFATIAGTWIRPSEHIDLMDTWHDNMYGFLLMQIVSNLIYIYVDLFPKFDNSNFNPSDELPYM